MTKAQLRSIIQNLLKKIDKTKKYHDVVVDHAIEHVMNQVFYDVFLQRPQELEEYCTEVGIDVATGPVPDEYYLSLDGYNYVPMPDKASGIRSIRLPAVSRGTYPKIKFYPMSETEYDLLKNSQAYNVISNTDIEHLRIGYVVRRTQIDLFNYPTAFGASDTLQVRILRPFTDYSDSDIVHMPHGKDIDIMRMVLEFFGIVPPVDLKDDNKDNV